MAAKQVELTFEERLIIESMLKEGKIYARIAEKLKRGSSCIRREIIRCGGIYNYTAEKAQAGAFARASLRGSRLIKDPPEEVRQQIFALRDADGSIVTISEKTNVSRGVVQRILWSREKYTNTRGYKTIEERVDMLEEQIKILFETLRSK